MDCVAWEIIGGVRDTETIATGPALKARRRLRKRYGAGRWRKCKGVNDSSGGGTLIQSERVRAARDQDQAIATGRSMTDAGVKRRFVIGVDNDGYPAALERGKVER